MITDKRITFVATEYKNRAKQNYPVTTPVKQYLVRLIAAKQRNICE